MLEEGVAGHPVPQHVDLGLFADHLGPEPELDRGLREGWGGSGQLTDIPNYNIVLLLVLLLPFLPSPPASPAFPIMASQGSKSSWILLDPSRIV